MRLHNACVGSGTWNCHCVSGNCLICLIHSVKSDPYCLDNVQLQGSASWCVLPRGRDRRLPLLLLLLLMAHLLVSVEWVVLRQGHTAAQWQQSANIKFTQSSPAACGKTALSKLQVCLSNTRQL
jgi:hypothetical protein